MKQKQGKCKSMSSNQNKLNRKYIFSIYKFLGEQGRIADSNWSIESCRSIDGTVLSIIFLIILSNTLAYLFIKVGQSHCLKV